MSTNQEKLLRYCRRDNTQDAIKVLNSCDDLDLVEKNGVVFRHATNHGNTKLLKALLQYYEKHQLNGDRESQEYKTALLPFRKIIDDLERCYDLEEKGVAQVLSAYLSSEEDEKQDDFANLDEVFEDFFPEHNGYAEHEQQVPEFCGWPEDLSHQRHLSGENSNGFSPEVH